MSIESLIIYIAGIILLAEVGLKRLINVAKLLKQLQATLRGPIPSPPPRALNESDSKRELEQS